MTGDAVHSADGSTSTRVMGKSSALTKWLQRLRALSTRCLLQISPLPPMLKRIPLIMKPTTSATSATYLGSAQAVLRSESDRCVRSMPKQIAPTAQGKQCSYARVNVKAERSRVTTVVADIFS